MTTNYDQHDHCQYPLGVSTHWNHDHHQFGAHHHNDNTQQRWEMLKTLCACFFFLFFILFYYFTNDYLQIDYLRQPTTTTTTTASSGPSTTTTPSNDDRGSRYLSSLLYLSCFHHFWVFDYLILLSTSLYILWDSLQKIYMLFFTFCVLDECLACLIDQT